MAESNTYTGVIGSVRTAYQALTSKDWFSAKVRWAAFQKTNFMRAIGLEGFGVPAMQDLQKFGRASPSGNIVRYDSGVYGLRGAIFSTTPTSYHVGRMSARTPELVEGGDEWAYSWHQIQQTEYIPTVDVDDNTKGNIDIKQQKMEGMKQKFVQDINYVFLGNSSAPDTGVMGPSVTYTDLPNLISVRHDRSVGAITKSAATYWGNQYKSIATIGGGGEMDRPIVLRRSVVDGLNDCAVNAEASNDFLMLGTQGAWQYWDRLMYADSVQGARQGAFGVKDTYDALGIPNHVIGGNPFIWDPAVTVPYGATASTEAIYGIHKPSFFISIRTEENFKWSGWEAPREHDEYPNLVARLSCRYAIGVTDMRPHIVFYNAPTCPD